MRPANVNHGSAKFAQTRGYTIHFFSLRTFLVTICCLALAIAAITQINRVRMNADLVTQDRWPRELVEIVDDLHRAGTAVEDIEVRHRSVIVFYWRMPAERSAVQTHIDKFQLSPVTMTGIEYDRIMSDLPAQWPKPDQTFTECHAFPVGLPGAQDGEFEFVMLYNPQTRDLMFYYYFNF